MKENNGKAARRKLTKKIGIIVGLFFIFLFVLTILGIGGPESKSRQTANKLRSMIGATGRQIRRKSIDYSKQFTGGGGLSEDEVMELVMSAKMNLIDLRVDQHEFQYATAGDYQGIYGVFCQLNFAAHKEDPSGVPMFRDLVGHSPDCDRKQYQLDLKKVTELARARDQQQERNKKSDSLSTAAKVLSLGGVVFHESRCGSTLVANTLIGMNPSHHRVYSESGPPAAAMNSICGPDSRMQDPSCLKQAAKALQDVIYLMSRSNDPIETHVFFKFQSITTKSLDVFKEAFPTTPWIFVYREPVQVMMSHFKDGMTHANCLRSKHNPPKAIHQLAKSKNMDTRELGNEQYCAAHLATLTESAVRALEKEEEESNSVGVAVNYESLPDRLYQDILPNKWKIHVGQTEIDNILDVSSKYSKGRGKKAGEWTEDSQRKEHAAPDSVKRAAALFMKESYDKLLEFTELSKS